MPSTFQVLFFACLCGISCQALSPPLPKAGICPTLPTDSVGLCIHACKSDANCSSTEKCCKTGCGGWDCANPVSVKPTTGSTTKVYPGQYRGCLLSNGTTVPHGSKFQDDCSWCNCSNGIASCLFSPSCIPSAPKGTPTPLCIPGTTFSPHPCTHCTCDTDKSNNIYSSCNTIACAMPVCSQGYSIGYVPGQCCPSCIPVSTAIPKTRPVGCYFNGKMFSDGQSFPSVDGCNNCVCFNGRVGCTKKACSNPCATMLCAPGHICVSQNVQCITSPCNPVGKCVPIPTPSSKPTCPLLSCPDLMYCDYGYVRGPNGCFTCSCNSVPTVGSTPALCPLVKCKACQYGYAINLTTGCRGCQCIPPTPKPTCALKSCPDLMYCDYGYVRGPDGCFTCACNSVPTGGPTPALCPVFKCQACQYGYAINPTTGCRGCQCIPPTPKPTCALKSCPDLMYCDYGYVRGPDGCFTCACNSVPTGGPTPALCPVFKCQACQYGYAINPKTGCRGCQCTPPAPSGCSYSDFYECFQNKVVADLLQNPPTSTIPQNSCQALKTAIQCSRQNQNTLSMTSCSTFVKNMLKDSLKLANKLLSSSCARTQCFSGGISYQLGKSYPSFDGCNTCYCSAEGPACTERACSNVCRYGNHSSSSGDTFPALDGCNKCSCGKEGIVACSKSKCDKTRYVRSKIVFDADLDKVASNESARGRFKKQFKAAVSKKMGISEAQITVLSVEKGSIVVIFAVESPNTEDAEAQLKQLIESQDLVVTFDTYQLTADNLDYSTQQQVGALSDEDGATNVGLIVGITCGCVAFVAIFVIIIILVTKKKTAMAVSYEKQSFPSAEAEVSLET